MCAMQCCQNNFARKNQKLIMFLTFFHNCFFLCVHWQFGPPIRTQPPPACFYLANFATISNDFDFDKPHFTLGRLLFSISSVCKFVNDLCPQLRIYVCYFWLRFFPVPVWNANKYMCTHTHKYIWCTRRHHHQHGFNIQL